MLDKLTDAVQEALDFRDIDPDTITRIDSTVGFIWFKAGEQTFMLDIKEAEFDLDTCAK